MLDAPSHKSQMASELARRQYRYPSCTKPPSQTNLGSTTPATQKRVADVNWGFAYFQLLIGTAMTRGWAYFSYPTPVARPSLTAHNSAGISAAASAGVMSSLRASELVPSILMLPVSSPGERGSVGTCECAPPCPLRGSQMPPRQLDRPPREADLH